MKDKKGFTLVELLITITLMLLILVLAIVDFNRVSKNKKEDLWQLVKKQIEDAAEDYFTTNEYLFEGLVNGSKGTISVGKLVKEDYINKVVDPITGKTISKCAIVNITKKDDKYNVKFDESSKNSTNVNCDTNNSVVVVEPGGPTATVKAKYNGKEHEKFPSWLNSKHLDPSVVVYPKTNGNGQIVSTVIGGVNGKEYKITDETKGKTLDVVVTNSSGKRYIAFIDYRRDIKPPVGSINIRQKDSWASSNVYLDLTASDNISGINEFVIDKKNKFDGTQSTLTWSKKSLSYSFGSVTYNGDTKSLDGYITDVAGNTSNTISSNNYKLYTDCQGENRVATGNWYNKSGATCSNKCGGTIAQERNTKDKNSGNACQKLTQNASCGGKKKNTGSWSNYSNCKSGVKTRTRTVQEISTYDNKTICSSTTEKDTKNCSTCEITSDKDIYGMIDSFDINLGVNVSCNGIGPWNYADNKSNGEQACAVIKTKSAFTLVGFAGEWGSKFSKTNHHITWNNTMSNNKKTFYKRTGCSAYMKGSSKCDPSSSRYVTVCANVKIDGSSNCSEKEFTICRGRNYDTKEYSDIKIY